MGDTSSIALCTYNSERFLPEQLESYRRQSKQPDELIVSDDGSIDRTFEILDDFSRSVPFEVRVYRHAEQVGPWRNFERAVSYCTKQIVFLSDHDDVWRSDKIEIIMNVFETRPNIAGAFSNAAVVDADLTPRPYTMWDSCRFTPELQAMFRQGAAFAALLDCHTIQAASLAFRANYRPMILPFSPLWPHDSWISIILAACADIVPVADNLMLYRQHGSNVVGAPTPKEKNRLQTLYDKLLNLPGYYRDKLQILEQFLRQLDDLQVRIDAQHKPEQFARPLAALADRRAKLRRNCRKAASVLALCGQRPIASVP